MALSLKFKKSATMGLTMTGNFPDGIDPSEGLQTVISINAGDVLKIKEYRKINQSLIVKIDESKSKYGYTAEYCLHPQHNDQEISELVEIIE